MTDLENGGITVGIWFLSHLELEICLVVTLYSRLPKKRYQMRVNKISQTQHIKVFFIDYCFVAAAPEWGEKFGGGVGKIKRRHDKFF